MQSLEQATVYQEFMAEIMASEDSIRTLLRYTVSTVMASELVQQIEII